ncbi:MAG: ribosome assembly RNA-binding protein YhbY [Ruminococcaceae bacterium]|nr:ribosome assembly RNA-binding protein YhbY [Oscillospiraceae bacterium]
MELSSKQRAWLRSQAQTLDTIFQVGKGGVNENMLKQIEDALEARELIKCKTLDNCEYSTKEAGEGIAAAVDAELVQVIGSKFVLFKISSTNRKYNVSEMKLIEKEASTPKKKTYGTKPAAKGTDKKKTSYTVTKRK